MLRPLRLAAALGGSFVCPVWAAIAPGLSLHAIEEPLLDPCTAIDPAVWTCSDLDIEADGAGDQRLLVVVSHADTLLGIQFGVEYSDAVDLAAWVACVDGLSVYEDGWPSSGTAAAFAFDPLPGQGPDAMSVIGYFRIGAGSVGRVRLTADDRVGTASWVDGGMVEHVFGPTSLGLVDVHRLEPGWNGCGRDSAEGVLCGARERFATFSADGFAPIWIRSFEGRGGPIAVRTVIHEDPSLRDHSGGAVVFAAGTDSVLEGFSSVRVTRDGVTTNCAPMGGHELVSGARNREGQLVVARGGAHDGFAFQIGSGEIVSDPTGGTTRLSLWTDASGNMARMEEHDGGFEEEVSAGAIVLHSGGSVVASCGKSFVCEGTESPPCPHGVIEVCRRTVAGVSEDCVQVEATIGEVLDAQTTVAGGQDVLVVLASLEPEGTCLAALDFPPAGALALKWIVEIEDPTGVDTSAVMTLDETGDALLARGIDRSPPGGPESELWIQKLAIEDGSTRWAAPLLWPTTGVGSIQPRALASDFDGGFAIAGRFEGAASVVKYPADPAHGQDWLWRQTFADSSLTEGVVRSLDYDDEGACLYAVGHLGDPADSLGATRLFAAAIDPAGGVDLYVLRPSRVPGPAVRSTSAVSVDATTDPYGIALPFPYVYVLGRAERVNGAADAILFRFTSGPCTLLEVGPVSVPGRGTWRVRGGADLLVWGDEGFATDGELRVFDVGGREVVRRTVEAGRREARIDGLVPGVYFVRLTGPAVNLTGRAVVIR
jgi:hypothetical protein